MKVGVGALALEWVISLSLIMIGVDVVVSLFRRESTTRVREHGAITITTSGFDIGLGDLVGYSMLAARILVSFGTAAYVASVFLVTVGSLDHEVGTSFPISFGPRATFAR